MNQDLLKRQAAEKAWEYVCAHVPAKQVIGVGTGSTVNYFIAAMARDSQHIAGAVASSQASALQLQKNGIPLLDANDVERLPIYVDGADEIDTQLRMIKGGGGALTREKIVAAISDQFVCIADTSKYVKHLGQFPLPLEVIPMAKQYVLRQLKTWGAVGCLRQDYVTDNGNSIIDVSGLDLSQPEQMKKMLNNLTGVVSNGIFACRAADVLLLASDWGVRCIQQNGDGQFSFQKEGVS